MKNQIALTILLFTSLLLTNCTYQSNVTLDEKPTIKVKPELLGNWISKDNDTLKIIKFDDFNYEIITKLEKKPLDLLAFESTVKKSNFINIWQKDKDTTSAFKYTIFKIDANKNKIKLTNISDSLNGKFNTSEDLRKYFETDMEKKYFYHNKKVDVYKKLK